MVKRVQRSRRKGARMPKDVVYVGRPGKWGNPYTTADAIRLYSRYVVQEIFHGRLDIAELRGKSLACWCPLDQPCHADVLLELMRKPSPARLTLAQWTPLDVVVRYGWAPFQASPLRVMRNLEKRGLVREVGERVYEATPRGFLAHYAHGRKR